MKLFAKSLVAASLATTAFAASPAAAQVSGIATASPEAVIVQSQARIAGYQQIEQTYAAQLAQLRTLRQEMATIQQTLDTNKDGQLSQQEASANQALVTQAQQKEQQLNQASQPIAMAQYYVIEQLIRDYNNAQQQVVQQKNIQLLLTPEAIQWGPDSVNVTDEIVAALNQRMPSVQVTPPAGWQPTLRETIAMHQAVQQVMMAAAQRAAQQQAQPQQPAARPTGR